MEWRAIQARPGDIPKAQGSCHVMIGNTEVIVAVTAAVRRTGDDCGRLRLHLEASSTVQETLAKLFGSTDFRHRRSLLAKYTATLCDVYGASPSDDRDEMVEPVRPTPLPLDQLALGHGYAFCLDIDITAVQVHSGSLLLAASCGIRGALSTLRLPYASAHEGPGGVVVDVDRSKLWPKQIPWNAPLILTLRIADGLYAVDPDLIEEATLSQHATVACTPKGSVCYFTLDCDPSKHKTARDGTMEPQDVRSIAEAAESIISAIAEQLDQQIAVGA